MARTTLTSDTTFTADNNPGTTVQDILNDLYTNYDLCGYVVTIQLTNTTHDPFIISGRLTGQKDEKSLIILGDETNPNNVIVYGSISVRCGAAATIKGIWIYNATGYLIAADDPGTKLWLKSIWFGHQFIPVLDTSVVAGVGSRVQILPSACRLRGNTASFLKALGPAQAQIMSGVTFTMENNPNFSIAFLYAAEGGLINSNFSWSGTPCTGAQYAASVGSRIWTGGTYTTLPGQSVLNSADPFSVVG